MPKHKSAKDFHVIRYSERMWIRCCAQGASPGEIVPLVYKGRATMWFSDEARGRVFVDALSPIAPSGPRLVPVSGIRSLHRLAVEVLKKGVVDIFFDLSPHGRAQTDSLGEFIEELRVRLGGKGGSSQN